MSIDNEERCELGRFAVAGDLLCDLGVVPGKLSGSFRPSRRGKRVSASFPIELQAPTPRKAPWACQRHSLSRIRRSVCGILSKQGWRL